jgi:hypothetical protein
VARRDPFESLPVGKAKSLPFPFVLEELAPLDPVTRPMFGALGVYVGERIVMILRDKGPSDADSGVWLAFEPEHEAAVVSALPRLCPIELFRTKVAGWKKLSSRSAEFESDVGVVCRLLLEGDERVGKVPGKKRRLAERTEPLAAKTKPARAVKKEAPRATAKGRPSVAGSRSAPASKNAAVKKATVKKAAVKKAAGTKAAPTRAGAATAPSRATRA